MAGPECQMVSPPARFKHFVGHERDSLRRLFVRERHQRGARRIQALQFFAAARARAQVFLHRRSIRGRQFARGNRLSNLPTSSSLRPSRIDWSQSLFQKIERRVQPRLHRRHRARQDLGHLFELESLINLQQHGLALVFGQVARALLRPPGSAPSDTCARSPRPTGARPPVRLPGRSCAAANTLRCARSETASAGNFAGSSSLRRF